MRIHRDFLRVWAGQAVSNLGDGVHRVAVLWWAKQATGSDAVVVLVALASVVPTLVAAPVAGWLVDRCSRRGLMLASDALRFGSTATLAAAAATGALSTWLVVGCGVLAALAGSVFDPALMASVTLLVPAERRAAANSMLGANGAVAGIVGPAAGGALVGLAGMAPALWFDAATFLVSFALVAASRIPMPPARGEGDHRVGIAGGVELLRADRAVRDLVVVAAGLNFFVAPVSVLIVSLAAGPLSLGGGGYGLLEAAIPAGMVVGLVLAPRVAGRARATLVALLTTGAAIAVSTAAPWAAWAGFAFVVAGAGVGVANTIIPSQFQERVAPEVQGRVFAMVGALSVAGRPLGLLLTAPLVAIVGVRAAFAACGVGLATVAWSGRRGLHAPADGAEGTPTPAAGGAGPVEFDECLG